MMGGAFWSKNKLILNDSIYLVAAIGCDMNGPSMTGPQWTSECDSKEYTLTISTKAA